MVISKDILIAVNQLEIRARRNVAALLAGNYKSPFRGSGMSFKEFRPYEPGDDVRHISWQVTARTGHAALKLYEEERELNIILLVDVSGSSLFQMKSVRRIDMYADLVALLGLAAVKAGDNVGMLFFNEKPVSFLPPRRSKDHVLSGLSYLLAQELETKKSDLRSALKFIAATVKTRSLVILLSDFLVPDFREELCLAGSKHEVLLFQCFDDAERLQSIEGIFEVQDPETGELLLLDANSPKMRKSIKEHHLQFGAALATMARSARAEVLALNVNEDYAKQVVHFFRRRGPSRL